MPRYPVRVDGEDLGLIEAATPEEALRKAHTQIQLQQRQGGQGGAPPTTSPLAPAVAAPAPPAEPPSGLMQAARVVGHLIPPSPTALFDVAKYVRGAPQGGTLGERVTASQAEIARMGPSLIPSPWLSGAASGAGEIVAQALEGREQPDYLQAGMAATIPPIAATAGRIARAVGRSATRLSPTLFKGAQETAQTEGAAMTELIRSPYDVGQLSAAARQAGADMIPAANIVRTVSGIRLPPKSANPAMEAVRTTIDNVKAGFTPVIPAAGQPVRHGYGLTLGDLEAVRRDIGPLVAKRGAPDELKALYGAMVQDLDAAAAAGGAGAAISREAAHAFKQNLGADRVAGLIDDATFQRVISGADVPVLNVGRLGQLVRKERTSLEKLIGPEGVDVVEAFVTKFRALPPDVAYNAWGRLLTTLGGLGGGGFLGASLGGVPGAVIGAITPEIIANMAVVGRNPRQLNAILTSLAQTARTGYVAPQRLPEGE